MNNSARLFIGAFVALVNLQSSWAQTTLNSDQIELECMTKGAILGGALVRYNRPQTKETVAAWMLSEISKPRAGPAEVPVNITAGRLWINDAISAMTAERRTKEPIIDIVGLQKQLIDLCVRFPQQHAVPPIIDWHKFSSESSASHTSTNARTPVDGAVSAHTLFKQYSNDWKSADANYEGKALRVTGKISLVGFINTGIAYSRYLSLQTSSEDSMSMVTLCFTETCESNRRPTMTDDAFKRFAKGETVVATCVMEPVRLFVVNGKSQLLGIALSKCRI